MKKAVIALFIAAVLLLSLAGCGKSASGSGFSPIEANVPELSSVTIDAAEPDFDPIEASVPELESTTIDAAEPDFDPIEANVTSLQSVTIDGTEFSFAPIETVLPSEDLSVVIHMPEYEFTEITVQDVTLSVPVIDYQISFDRIESAYTDTFTVPALQVEIPNYADAELEDIFVSIADNLSPEDQVVLAGMSDAEFAEIAAVHLNLTDVLLETYKFAGITVAVDPLTGTIPIDTSLLFDTDKYELKPEGKEALKAVFAVYYSVISRPEFRDAVDSIVIEGHTDTQGDHEYNQQLSERRAQAVYDFLLSDECGFPDRAFLQSLLATVGRSYDDPVYAADGTVDMAASRRVEIHCVPNLDQ